ncbi:MAG: helix-hairpin-helix domain-containing protein [Thermodesulfobacteriota bacterium]
MSYFSRSQQGVILLLGAALLLLWAWRGNFGLPPAAAPARTLNQVFVEVAGNIPHPGVFVFPQPPPLSQVLAQAGGAGTAGDDNPKLPSGSRVEISSEGQPHLTRMSGPQLLTLGLALDINQATAADLDALPGIGPALARRIIEYRQAHGPFKKIDDLEQVSGIGPKKLAQIKPYVFLEDKENNP